LHTQHNPAPRTLPARKMLASTSALAPPCTPAAPLAAHRRVAASSCSRHGLPLYFQRVGMAPSARLLLCTSRSLAPGRKQQHHPIVASTRPAPGGGVSSGAVGSGSGGGVGGGGFGLRVGALLISSSTTTNTRRSVAALARHSYFVHRYRLTRRYCSSFCARMSRLVVRTRFAGFSCRQ
jgi:hypothetical protein